MAKRATEIGQRIAENREAQPLRDRIERLEQLSDPDHDEAIALKREKLRNLLATSSPTDQERVAALSQPEAWEMATPQELRLIYLEFVQKMRQIGEGGFGDSEALADTDPR